MSNHGARVPYDLLRQFNKRFLNPLMRRLAVTPRSHFAIIRHIGRRSGKPYETPVIAMRYEDGFVFALTYGPEVDWYRNVLAAGRCTLFWRAQEYVLEQPELLHPELALEAFPKILRGILRRRGIQNYFKMRICS